MKETNSHIVSSFRWDTTFDRKDKAQELHERLSAWSRFIMPGEMAAVFDKICPPDQTWRIKPFELDFGFIHYNDLEQELSKKLSRQLHEKLLDLVFYAGRRGSGTIEIVDGETSRLSMLAAFLVSGLMPWNYQAADGTVNQLMAYQVQHNRREAIAMIRQVGAEHTVARKRLAWQFNEPVIISIIQGLEPNYHTQIIAFSNDMAAIQQKGTVVKASVGDLKKNLWHWILNYLLKERGTLFNKVEFMKSSIRQMAAHYNVAYHELLTLIQKAVDMVIERTSLRSEFVVTLKALSESNRNAREAAEVHDNVTDHWQDLEAMFRKPGQCNTSEKKKAFNELVINLEQQDSAKFSALLASLGTARKVWAPAVQQLNDPSLEVIFSSLNAVRAPMLVETIYFIHSLALAVNIKISRKLLWNTGLDFLHSHKNQAFDHTVFARYCINAISENKKMNAGRLLAQLATASISGPVKTLAMLDVYTGLYNSGLSSSGSAATFDAAAFQKLLHRLGRQLNSGHIATEQFKEWQGAFAGYMQADPLQVVNILTAYPDKQVLALLLDFVMAKTDIQALAAHIDHRNIRMLLWLQKIAGSLTKEAGTGQSHLVNAAGRLARKETYTEELLSQQNSRQAPGRTEEDNNTGEEEEEAAEKETLVQARQKKYEQAAGASKEAMHISKENTGHTLAEEQLAAPGMELDNKTAAHTHMPATGPLVPEDGEPVSHLFSDSQGISENRKNIQRLLSSLKESEREQLKEEIIDRLINTGMRLFISNPGMAPLAFLRGLLKQMMAAGAPGQQNAVLYQLLGQLPAGEVLQSLGITQQVLTKLKETLPAPGREFHIEQVQRFIRITKTPKAATGQWLLANYEHPGFIALRKQNSSAATELIHYFLPGGKGLLDTLLKEYSLLPALYLKGDAEATVIQVLKGLFWQVLLDHTGHHGNALVVERLFKGAVAVYFNISETAVTAFLPAATDHSHSRWVQLKNGSRLSLAQFYLLAEQCLASANGTAKYRGTTVGVAGLMQLALRMQAAPLLKMFARGQVTAGAAARIRAAVPFNEFVQWLMQDSGALRPTLKALCELADFINCILPGTGSRALINILWQDTWLLVKNGRAPSHFLSDLAGRLFKKIPAGRISSPAQVSGQLYNNAIVLSPELTEVINYYLPGIGHSKIVTSHNALSELLRGIEEKGLLEDLALYIIINKKAPAWFHLLPAGANELPIPVLLNSITAHHPALFLKIYSHRVLPQSQLEWLGQAVNFNDLTVAIAALQGNKRSLLGILAQLHTALGHLVIHGISGKALQHLLFKKVMDAWAGNDWRPVSTEVIWNELIWDASSRYGVQREIFMRAVTKQLTMFPPSLQTAFSYLAELNKAAAAPALKPMTQKLKPKHVVIPIRSIQNQGGIPVKNAGIVLLQSYVPLLFERLKLVHDKTFNNDADQADAAHYLQYVVTGLTQTEESLLPLNKVLCGLPFTTPLKPGIDMTEDRKVLVDGLINAAMGYWPAIGTNSINGFRGNWLVRDGLLTEQEERWELTVDKRAYDILIHKSPFSFSIIKYPWMDKPLHVNWPY